MADLRSGLGCLSLERIQLGLQGFDLALARFEQFPELFVLLPSLTHFCLETNDGLRQRLPRWRRSGHGQRGRPPW